MSGTYARWHEGQEYEGRLFFGAYSWTRVEGPRGGFAAPDSPMRAAILQARERYNQIRMEFGLPVVVNWRERPGQLIQRLPAPTTDSITSVARMKQLYDIDIVIETPRGTVRRGPGWAVMLPYDYGYIRGTIAPDGEPADCMVGLAFLSSNVYLIDQVKLGTKIPDEPKVMFAYPSLKTAMIDFLLGYSDNRGPERIGKVTSMSMEAFKTNVLPQWETQVRKKIHIHIHDSDRYGRIIVDSKWTGTYSAVVNGKQVSIEAAVEAPDAYTAGDRLREKFEKKYGTNFSYPVARFKGGPKRLDPGSISARVAAGAGEEETVDSELYGPFSRNRSIEEIKKDIERTKLGLSGVRGARRLGYQEELEEFSKELKEAEERRPNGSK